MGGGISLFSCPKPVVVGVPGTVGAEYKKQIVKVFQLLKFFNCSFQVYIRSKKNRMQKQLENFLK